MHEQSATSEDGCRGLRVMHFRRVFPVLSESFIYDPMVRMGRRGLDATMLSVVQLPRRIKGVKPRKLVWLPPWLHVPKMLDRLGGKRFQQSELDFWLAPLLNVGLRWQIQRHRPDIIMAHFGPDGCLVLPAARQAGVPLAVGFYGYDVTKLIHTQGERWRRKYRFLFRYADVLIAISTHIADRLIELGADPRKVVKVHLGADMTRFTYRDPAATYDGGTVRCVHVGRLTPKKSPLRLLEAFARAARMLPALADGKPPLHLTIVGDGELFAACHERIDELNLRRQVTMAGALRHERVSEILARSHLYTQHCVTTPDGDTEGLGLSFVEASASGLPVVSTIHNGIPEVVLHERTGLLGPEGDVDAMASHIAHLAQRPDLWTAMGRAGRDHVEQHFTLDHAIDRQMSVLAAAVARHRRMRAASHEADAALPEAMLH
jgi:colanic acid/amylovoran biosynthesis glycosyltransferase